MMNINDDIDEMFLIDDVIDKIDERFLNINKIMNEKIQKYNDIIAEYTDDYNNIKKIIKDVKKNKGNNNINILINNIDNILITQGEKIKKKY